MKGRDIYADLEKIEERGKRKKDKKASSMFGRKDEPEEPAPAPKTIEQPKPSIQKPARKPAASQPRSPAELQQKKATQTAPSARKPLVAKPVQSPRTDERPKSPEPQHSPRQMSNEPRNEENKAEPQGQQAFSEEELEPLEPMGGSEDYKARDIYADLQKIEERGSKKKQQAPVSKSFWGRKEPEKKQVEKQAPEPQRQAEFDACRACGASLTPGASSCDICGAKLMETVELQPAQPQPVLSEPARKAPELAPVRDARPVKPQPEVERKEANEKAAPIAVQPAEEEKPAQEQASEKVAEASVQEEKPAESASQEWKPLEGRERKRAEEALYEFKRKLDSAFKSGVLTKEQCLAKVKEKETELGLRPPTGQT